MESVKKVIELYERVKELEKAIENIIKKSAENRPNCRFCEAINSVACKMRKE